MPLLNGASRSGSPSDHQRWRIREKIHRGLPVCFTQFKGKSDARLCCQTDPGAMEHGGG